MEARTGLIPGFWKKCGETPSSGRLSGFLLHENTDSLEKAERGRGCKYLV